MKQIRDTRGVLTLEACIMVPIFVALMLVINGLFVLFMGQQILTHTLIQTAKSLALDPYSVQKMEGTSGNLDDMFLDLFSINNDGHMSTEAWYEDADGLETVVKERYLVYLKESNSAAAELLEVLGVEGGIGGLDFSGTTLENGVLTVKLKYTQNYVYDATGLASFTREIGASVKLFEYVQGS